MLSFIIETVAITAFGFAILFVVRKLLGKSLSIWKAAVTSFAVAFLTILVVNVTIYASLPMHLPNNLAALLIFFSGIPLLTRGTGMDRANRQNLMASLQGILDDPEESDEKKEWAAQRLEAFRKL